MLLMPSLGVVIGLATSDRVAGRQSPDLELHGDHTPRHPVGLFGRHPGGPLRCKRCQNAAHTPALPGLSGPSSGRRCDGEARQAGSKSPARNATVSRCRSAADTIGGGNGSAPRRGSLRVRAAQVNWLRSREAERASAIAPIMGAGPRSVKRRMLSRQLRFDPPQDVRVAILGAVTQSGIPPPRFTNASIFWATCFGVAFSSPSPGRNRWSASKSWRWNSFSAALVPVAWRNGFP